MVEKRWAETERCCSLGHAKGWTSYLISTTVYTCENCTRQKNEQGSLRALNGGQFVKISQAFCRISEQGEMFFVSRFPEPYKVNSRGRL